MLDIEHLLDRRPRELSGGQKQRVAIGSTICRQPKVFLMDEPLSNLDAKLRAQMRVELARIHEELGCTIVYVTHDQTEAMTLGTQIVVMKSGVIQQAAAPELLYNQPANVFVAGFIGSPAMNFFDARIISEQGKTYAVLESMDEPAKIQVKGLRGDILKEHYLNQTVIMGIRPEDLYDGDGAVKQKIALEDNRMEAVVNAREMLGHEVHMYFAYPEKDFSARLSSDVKGDIGDRMILYMDMDKVHFFDKETEKNIFYSEV